VTAAAPAGAPVILDIALHPAQMQVMRSSARFKVVACGRRFGKTFFAVNWLIYRAGSRAGIHWWVAPRHDQTDVAWRWFTEALPPELVEVNRTKKTARLWNGSLLGFKTASDPDALRSEGLDSVVVDEAAFVKSGAWISALRPALADKRGHALLIGTFNGENWFYDLYQRGQDADHPEWESWRFPSSANPFLDPEEIEEARRTMPRAEFEQEFLANPLVYVGAVFDGESVQAASERGRELAWREDLPTYAGLDWGYTNPTALEVCQESAEGRVHWVDERTWTAVELNARCAEIVEVCRRYGVRMICADAAGATENRTLAQALGAARLKTKVQPVPFGKWKDAGIQVRRYYLEQGMEAIGPKCRELLANTKRYRYQENRDEVVKEDDHTVDAATAFYATRLKALGRRG
jgi:hypothetical protein